MGEETKEVAVIPVTMGDRGVTLHNIDEAWRFAEAIESSGIAPKGIENKAKIFAVVVAGSELGLTPFRSLSNMKIINGRVGPMGALAKALVRREKVLAPGTGFKQDFIGVKGTDEYAARIVTLRAGESEPYTTIFSVGDAKLAGLWGKTSRDGSPSVWMKYPDRMLTWRAVGFHMDDYYSDVIMGMHIAEVLGDYPEADLRLPSVMEKLDEPIKDPLLDAFGAKYAAAVEAVAADLQPPSPKEAGTEPQPPHPIITDPIEGPKEAEWPPLPPDPQERVRELQDKALSKQLDALRNEKVGAIPVPDESAPYIDAETGEYRDEPSKLSPLEATLAEKAAEAPPMTEEEAMADMIREGVVKEEDLAPANPDNKAEEGKDQEDLF